MKIQDIFSIKRYIKNNKKKIKISILRIKFSFSYKKLRTPIIEGNNNFISESLLSAQKECHITIKGNNNKIICNNISTKVLNKLHIAINGDNNTIIIEDGLSIWVSLYINMSLTLPPYTINNSTVKIGKNTYFGGACIDISSDNSNIDIGEDCMIANKVRFRTGELHHLIFDSVTGKYIDCGADIKIGNHVWIGEDTIIMKKAQIPNNCIIGIGSIVTRKFDTPHSVIAGNPAKVCKNNIDWVKNEMDLKDYPKYAESYFSYRQKAQSPK